MTTDALAKVNRGQRFEMPAAAYNAFVDAAKANKGLSQSATTQGTRRAARFVRVMNSGDEPVPRFGVIGLDEPVILPGDSEDNFKNQLVLKGALPEYESHFGRFAIVQEPLEPGKIGRAIVSGVTIARVSVGAESEGIGPIAADIWPGDSAILYAGMVGSAEIIWREGGLDEQWAVVRLGSRIDGSRVDAIVDSVNATGADSNGAFTASDVTYDVRPYGLPDSEPLPMWATQLEPQIGRPTRNDELKIYPADIIDPCVIWVVRSGQVYIRRLEIKTEAIAAEECQ